MTFTYYSYFLNDIGPSFTKLSSIIINKYKNYVMPYKEWVVPKVDRLHR